MNREKKIRLTIFQILSGNLTYEGGNVTVDDALLNDDSADIYVLLTEQRADMKLDFCMNSWICEQDVEVYSKAMQTLSKDVIDDVSEQIEDLLHAALSSGIEEDGWQLNNIYLASSNSTAFELSPTKSQVSKFLTFRLQATKL